MKSTTLQSSQVIDLSAVFSETQTSSNIPASTLYDIKPAIISSENDHQVQTDRLVLFRILLHQRRNANEKFSSNSIRQFAFTRLIEMLNAKIRQLV
jgi:hypothetical protein